jgi:hypothetical protein
MRNLLWAWRHCHIRLTRAQWEAAEAAAAAMRAAPMVTEPWPHEMLRRRRPYTPPAPARDQMAAQLDRQLIWQANRGR